MYDACTRNSLTVIWKPPLDDGGSEITSFALQMKDVKGTKWTSVSSTISSNKQRIMKLTEHREYLFRVAAENKFGLGEWLESKPRMAKLPYGKQILIIVGLNHEILHAIYDIAKKVY